MLYNCIYLMLLIANVYYCWFHFLWVFRSSNPQGKNSSLAQERKSFTVNKVIINLVLSIGLTFCINNEKIIIFKEYKLLN